MSQDNQRRDSDDIYIIEQNIYKSHDYYMNNSEFNILKSGAYTSIAITFVYDVNSLEYLIKTFTRIFFKKNILNSRKAHGFLFEFAIRDINRHCANSIELHKIEQHIGMCAALINKHRFNVEKVLEQGYEGHNLVMWLTPKQSDQIEELKEKLGFRSKGVVALICVIWALNAAFKNRDFRYDKNEDEMILVREYWSDDGVIKNIKQYMQEHENELRGYISGQYAYLKVELERSKLGKELTVDKKRIDCLTKIINAIEKKGFNK